MIKDLITSKKVESKRSGNSPYIKSIDPTAMNLNEIFNNDTGEGREDEILFQLG